MPNLFFLERHELKESQITEAFIGNKPCFLESQQWRSVILENNPRSEIHYPTRASFFAVAASRARL
jgi:hypothetical protein